MRIWGIASVVLACSVASAAYGQTKPHAKGATAKPKPRAPQPPPPPPDDPTKANVMFISQDPTVQYVDLCSAPCTLTMSSGVHNVSLSKDGGAPRTDLVTLPAGPSTVTGTYVSRSTAKTVLILLGVVATVAGGVMLFMGNQDNSATGEKDTGLLIAGGLVGTAGLAMFVGGLFTNDQVKFTVTPGTSARLDPGGLRVAW